MVNKSFKPVDWSGSYNNMFSSQNFYARGNVSGKTDTQFAETHFKKVDATGSTSQLPPQIREGVLIETYTL